MRNGWNSFHWKCWVCNKFINTWRWMVIHFQYSMWKLARNLFPLVLKGRSKFNWHFHKLSCRVMFYVYILSLQDLSGLIKGTGQSFPFAFYHVAPWFTLLLQEVIEISSCHALHIECERENECQSTYALQASKSCRNSRYNDVGNIHIYRTYYNTFDQNLIEQRNTDPELYDLGY